MFKVISFFLILAVIQISESAPVYQFLPPKEGYVPVYIRLGDTPLDEINPDLASAFHEDKQPSLLEDQMVNDAPSNDDDEEEEEVDSLEHLRVRTAEFIIRQTEDGDVVTEKIQTPIATEFDYGDDEDEEDEPDVATTTKNSKPDDDSGEEAPKGKRNVSGPPPNTKVAESSEESVEKVAEKHANSSNESKSKEEVAQKS